MKASELKIDYAERRRSGYRIVFPAAYDGYVVQISVREDIIAGLQHQEGSMAGAISIIEREMLLEMHRLEDDGQSPSEIVRYYPLNGY